MNKTLFFLYGMFLLMFTVFSYAFVDPNLIYLKDIYTGFAFNQRLLTTIIYALFIFLFFAVYFSIFKKRNKLKVRDLKVLLATTVGILFLAYPAMLSYDIFNYISTAKVAFFYRENPYLIMPIEFSGDPFFIFTRATNKTALYGPFWILLSLLPFAFGFGKFLLILLNFKLLMALFYAGASYLIWKISKNIVPVVLFSFNPLIIIETLVSGHNDIVMMFLALLSFLLLSKNRLVFAILMFTLSIFIKYASIFLLPIFLVILFRKIKKEDVNWEKTFFCSALLMLLAFLLSPIREEIYSWYAIWFLPFAFLVPKNKILLYVSIAFSLGLMLRYVPFMLLGTYLGPTPYLKTFLTFIPAVSIFILFSIKDKLWLKIFSR